MEITCIKTRPNLTMRCLRYFDIIHLSIPILTLTRLFSFSFSPPMKTSLDHGMFLPGQ